MMSMDGVEGGKGLGTADGPVRTQFSNTVNRGERGLRCRECGCRDLRVIYTRDRTGGRRRKRRCRHCGTEIWTMESTPSA